MSNSEGQSDQAGKPTGDDAARPSSLGRVEEIFFEVAAISPHDREEAIRRLCGGDSTVEAEVRSLVRSAVQLGGFLEQPALGRQFDQLASESKRIDPPDDLVGATLGAFRVERRIASGGMGTVYLAARSDGQFEQKVALKVVKRGMDSEEILRRFRTERQTLAGLDHPNIARLIDGGATPDGRPFVVMEYIEGEPIDVYCNNKGLGLRDRLRLFREVCEGVQHAHQNLVIHRDIKPSNILVTASGTPKLLDFGIAKVLSGSTDELARDVTADTDRRLTPEYASPEQVEGGSLTTASDVYSLGVVLYELLTGARPYQFSLRTSEEVRRVVCTVEPMPPSQAVTVRASRLRATDGLSSKKLRTGTAAPRHATVSEDPGKSPSSGSTGHSTTQPRTRGVSSTRLRGLLKGDLDIIVLMALRKEPHRRYVSAEQFSSDIGRFLDGMPVQARKDTLAYRASKFIRRHAAAVSAATLAVVLLAGATVLLHGQRDELRRQKSDLVATNRRLAESRRFLQTVISGAGTGNQGPDARLGDVLKDAAATLRSAPPSDPLTLAAAESESGRAMMSLGMLDDARPLLEDADRLFRAGLTDVDTLADSAMSLAELAFYEGKYAEAERTFRTLLAEERTRNGGTPTERESSLLNNLGSSIRAQGRADEAIDMQREALRATMAVLGEKSLEAAETRNNLASALFQRGDVAEAEKEFSQAYEARKALLRPGHPLLVRCESNLGLARLRLGKTEEAITLLTDAAQSWDKAFGPDHPGRVATMTSLSQALRKQQRFSEALDWLNKCMAWQQAHQAPGTSSIVATEANIGITLGETGQIEQARAILERVVPRLAQAQGAAGIRHAAAEALARIYEQAGDSQRARELRERLEPK